MVDNTHQVKHQQTSPEWGPTAWAHLSTVRTQSPLIQCITNFVSMDLMANTLLSAGASPAMIHSLREIPEFTPAPPPSASTSARSPPSGCRDESGGGGGGEGGQAVGARPVAAGASGFRLEACRELVGMRPTVVRGNGSEILALANASVGPSKGVDSSHESTDAVEAAKSLAKSSGCIVAVSGAVDFVTDGQRVVGAQNGVAMMQKITATGCSVTALIAAFVAIDPLHAFEATATALSIFGIAGEIGWTWPRVLLR
ncbi:hypothetical protein C3L33_17460, partial [Rhododendron williamsianum]